jgi:hypothetical protein
MAPETKKYSVDEAHLFFAKSLNGEVWELLQKMNRSKDENETMLYAAFASAYHWLHAGTGVHHQRAEWLLSHIYAELGTLHPALSHASRCFELTNEFPVLMKDFDRAYAFEALARANALVGNKEEAIKYIQLADEAGQAISNEEDKAIFQGDFNGGDWHGLR